jgi:iron complex outermembrane receptor protein
MSSNARGRMTVTVTLAVACLVLLAARMAGAEDRAVAGVVRDPQQAIVTGAEVVLIDARSGGRVRTITDGTGAYAFTAAPGTYVVEVHASGFERAASDPIVLAAGDRVTRDFLLTLAAATESITVNGAVDRAYGVDVASTIGSSGPARLLDTPLMLNILPGELLANAQVKSVKEALKFLPLVEFQEMQGSEIMRPETRGIQGSNMQNTRMDGMGIVVTGANNLESVEQIEVLNGLGAAMYGPANPSGMFNFVPKRPTEHARRRVAIGYDGHSIGTIHGDVGGRLGPGRRLGYRANLLAADGGAFVRDSRLARRLISLAGDVRPFRSTVVEAMYSDYHLLQRGFPGWFTYGRPNSRSPFILLPADAPDPARQGYGQPDVGLDLTTRIGELRVRQPLSAGWRVTAGMLDQLVTRDISTQVNALTDSAGSYTASLAFGFAPKFRVLSNLASVNGPLTTGRIRHDVAFGTTGYAFRTYSDFVNPSAASVLLGRASIDRPVVFALPAAGLPSHDRLFLSSIVHQQGFNATDTAWLTPRWSVRAAASQDWIRTDTYNNIGARTGGYRGNGISPSASLLYKPAPNMTVYGSYGSSLQQGDVAPTTVANPGQALPPYRSRQIEAGYKIAVSGIRMSAAVFRLRRPFANIDADNVFSISGEQINYGVEATLSGRLAQRLILYGGFTALDPTLQQTGNPATDGRQFVGIPRFKSSVLTEYQLPAGAGTFVSLNWQTLGRRPIDDVNSSWTPAANIVDLGVRYARTIARKPTVWRFGVNNVGDVHYWSTLGPGNITGTNVGSYTGHLGAPRTVVASMEFPF